MTQSPLIRWDDDFARAEELPLSPDAQSPRGWDFLGHVPVPVRLRVRDGVADVVSRHAAQSGEGLKCCFPMGQGGIGPLKRLRFIRQFEAFPNMLVSAEDGGAFNRRFYERHVATGAFASCQPDALHPAFAAAGLADPKGWIGVFAVAPFVFLIDRQKLNGLPVPRRWSDLLEPDYRGQIVFGGWRPPGESHVRTYNVHFLLSMERLFGRGGLEKLLVNIGGFMHSAEMPRRAGSNRSLGGIYVLPWSLADLCPRRVVTEVVWPEDGALAYPLWLTVKASARQRLSPLIDYFYGDTLARYLDHNHYPATSRAALPPDAKLVWLGWDYVRHPSLPGDVKRICAMVHAREPFSAEGESCA